jgi:hypothetical protein
MLPVLTMLWDSFAMSPGGCSAESLGSLVAAGYQLIELAFQIVM